MTQVSSVSTTSSSDQTFGDANTLNDLSMDDFLDLMIAELQNQDPLNPLENDELIAQISQIREVGATEDLTNTLNAVLLGQNISSATNLIGADVVALDENGQRVSGNVQVVSIVDGQPKLDLAVSPSADASTTEGIVADGSYNYAVVWETETGENYGIEIATSTSSLEGFSGSIELENIPATDAVKRVYRTDSSGSGDRYLVGTIDGSSTTFTDIYSDDGLSDGEILSGEVYKLDYATSVTVTLDNVGEIRPPVAPVETISSDTTTDESTDETTDDSSTEEEITE